MTKVTARGQVTIPAAIRKQADLQPRTEVDVSFDGIGVRIAPARGKPAGGAGTELIEHLRERGDIALTTDAIMRLTREG